MGLRDFFYFLFFYFLALSYVSNVASSLPFIINERLRLSKLQAHAILKNLKDLVNPIYHMYLVKYKLRVFGNLFQIRKLIMEF
jgi:hypothetical protein